MGKKAGKRKADHDGNHATTGSVPWKAVDKDPVALLVAPQSSADFFSKHWEKQPLYIKATPERLSLFNGLCSFASFVDLAKKREGAEGAFEFGVDVNAARYRDGVRETPNGEVADSSTLTALFKDEGCTLQVHQPQRFIDPLWRLMSALEAQLSCLVGSNAYITPAGSQGLAPHHDDVELWVVQTSGSKRWRLYKPLGGYELPNADSGDLDESLIGDPVLEVELQPGDVLYLPRGTVHQAEAQQVDSAHITISTYQRWTWADLGSKVLEVGLSTQGEPECLPLAARQSLSPGLIAAHSLQNILKGPGEKIKPPGVEGMAQALRAIADKLEQQPELFVAGVHAMSEDFWDHRLPPHPQQLAKQGPQPSMEDSIWCRAAGYSYVLPEEGLGVGEGIGEEVKASSGKEGDKDEDEEEEDGGGLKVVSCLNNTREMHMMHLPGSEDEDDELEGMDNAALFGSDGDDDGSDDDYDDLDDEAAHAAGVRAVEAARAAAAKEQAKKEKKKGKHKHGHCCDDKGCSKNKAAAGNGMAAAAAGGKGEDAGVVDLDEDDFEAMSEDMSDDEEDDGEPMRGLLLPKEAAAAALKFMQADSADKAIAIKDLPMEHDPDKLQLAFALWAEGLATCVPQQQAGKKQQQGAEGQKAKKKAKVAA